MCGHAQVSLKDLEELQSNLRKISLQLDSYDHTIGLAIRSVGENWRDQRYEEFINDFKQHEQKISEISNNYKKWANGYLQEQIESVKNYLSYPPQKL